MGKMFTKLVCKWCQSNQISFTNIMTYYYGQVKVIEGDTQRLCNFLYRLDYWAITWPLLATTEQPIGALRWPLLPLHWTEQEAYGILYPQRSSNSFKRTQNVSFSYFCICLLISEFPLVRSTDVVSECYLSLSDLRNTLCIFGSGFQPCQSCAYIWLSWMKIRNSVILPAIRSCLTCHA